MKNTISSDGFVSEKQPGLVASFLAQIFTRQNSVPMNANLKEEVDKLVHTISKKTVERNQPCQILGEQKQEDWEAMGDLVSFLMLLAGFSFLFQLAYSEYLAFRRMKDAEELERSSGRRHHSVSIGEFIKYR